MSIETKSIFYQVSTSPVGSPENSFERYTIIGDQITAASQLDPTNPLQVSEKLAGILKKEIKIEQNENILFITWDHGSAFGIFRDDPPLLPRVRKSIYDQNDLKRFPYLRGVLDKMQ